MEKRGITVAGSLLADLFYNVSSYPGEGLLTQAIGAGMSIGGTGNIILDLARLDPDLEVKVVAKMGSDEISGAVLSSLKKQSNVNVEGVVCEGESSRTLVINSQDTKQRTFFYIPAASDEFGIDNIPWDTLDSKIFMLEYLLLMKRVDSPDSEYGTHGARILAEAQRRGMITSVDVVSEVGDRARTVVSAALKYTDICCINELEAEAITGISITKHQGENDTECATRAAANEIFAKIRDLGVSRWIVVHTRDFGWGYDCRSGECVFLKSLALPAGYVKGSTGAGDAYCSGILYGAHEEYSLADSMRLARAAAAASLSENNGTDGMRPISEVLKLGELYG